MFEGQEKREETILNIINKAIESIAVYKAMISIFDKFKDDSIFITLLNNCALISVIRVCNIIGTDNENNHWKKLFGDHDLFRNKVILSVFKDLSEYADYNNMFKKFRNNFAVHYIGDTDVELPEFEKALKLLFATLGFILENYKYVVDKDPVQDAKDFYDLIFNKTVNMFKTIN